MNKLLLLLAVLGLRSFTANAQLIVEYRFEVMPAGTGTTSPFLVNGSMLSASSNFSWGIGLAGPVGFTQGASLVNPDKALWGSGWTPGGSVDPLDWFGFTMTPLPGYLLGVDSIVFWERRSATGPQFWQIRYGPIFGTAIGSGPTMLAATFPMPAYFGKRVVIPSGLAFAAPLELRIYAYQSTSNAGTWRIDTVRVYTHTISILPVELLSFTGEAVDEDVQLKWTTASELENDHFEIMRSDDGQAWLEVGRVPGSGTTSIPRDYGLLDEGPSVGTNYYKLRQVDWDGEYEDSHTISVNVGEQEWFRRTGDLIISDQPTMLFDELGRTISGPSREHRISQAGMFFLQQEDRRLSTRLFVAP